MPHSPGPFRMDDDGHVLDANGQYVVVYGVSIPHGYIPRDDESRGNGRMLVDRWDLLAALKRIAGLRGQHQQACDAANEAIQIARDAVAKAEGRS